MIDIDSGEYGGGDYLRSLYGSLLKSNNRHNFNSAFSAKSPMQEAVLISKTPVNADESATATVRIGGVDITGHWINRDECLNWRGPIPIERYRINTDSAAIINKNLNQTYDQIQNISIKYLKPPPLKPAGILIL